MHVTVQSENRLNVIALPETVGGAHWLSDASGTRLAFVEARKGHWCIEPCEGLSVRGADRSVLRAVMCDPNVFTVINIDRSDGSSWCVVLQPEDERSLSSTAYRFAGNLDISIGRAADNTIVYDNGFVSGHHAKIAYRNSCWYVADAGSTNGTFLNGARLVPRRTMHASYGDVLTILGLRITLGAGFVSMNCPNGDVHLENGRFERYRAPQMSQGFVAPSGSRLLFSPALRFPRTIERKRFVVDPPPKPTPEENVTLLQRIGPSILMGCGSLISICMCAFFLVEMGASVLRALPMAIMAVAMLAGCVVWPIYDNRKKRDNREKAETMRRNSYLTYLHGVLGQVSQEAQLQRSILEENRVPVRLCIDMARRSDSRLMSRTPLHHDFLDVRIGVGDEPFEIEIDFPAERFSVESDELRIEAESLVRQPRTLSGVPVAFSLADKPVVGIVGARDTCQAFVRGTIVQLAALSSYEDVRVVVLCDGSQRGEWEFCLHLPHCFSEDRSVRYFASEPDEIAEMDMRLEGVLEERRSPAGSRDLETRPTYVVICDSRDAAAQSRFVRSLAMVDKVGFAFVSLASSMNELPKECRSVIELKPGHGYVLDRDGASGGRKAFVPDIAVSTAEASSFALDMARLHLNRDGSDASRLPSGLSLLELLQVGSVDHINIASRWRESNASATLACPVGVDETGQQVLLNLHERFHGPHGLIAGTTGSGKSEFIITYILSMALTYAPDDVAFVLIDYKGGGLARTFDNEHVRLPHLAGVITNLDGDEIRRCLISIQSELKRRQALFNRTRDIVGGAGIDIYSYLDLYRQGRVSEPCPHLFIIADEFAELKQQQPDFMDELISTARIGRSLGVHLVLATQKPSGVVNDQIWSNARFKVCLKVADAADSIEMIRRADAAELQDAGRFYLLVGYNELFVLGQAAFSGARYVARDRFVETRDESVVLISNTGHALVTVKPHAESETAAKLPESAALLAAIESVAAGFGISARKLWLDQVPAMITVDDLARKYNCSKGAFADRAGKDADPAGRRMRLAPIIGEYDDPANQVQGVLRLPLTDEGSAVIYGTPDSGVELALESMLYSLLATYDARDLNAYIVDCGTGTLRAFAPAPQVGDVIGVDDAEKARRFFDFLDGLLAERRTRMAGYGGSFDRYRLDNDDLPALVIVINDIAAFSEAFPELEDRLANVAREAGRGGLFLVVSAANPVSVRLRVRQMLRQAVAVNLADVSDYVALFGPKREMPLPRGYGRGLARVGSSVFEFQAAHLAEDGDDYGFALRFSQGLVGASSSNGMSFAPAIPVAPDSVEVEDIASLVVPDGVAAYGIYDDDLAVAGFDFDECPIARCHFQRRRDGAQFARAFVGATVATGRWDVVVLDMSRLFGGDLPSGCMFATSDDSEAKEALASLMAKYAIGITSIADVKPTGAGVPSWGERRPLVVMSGIADFLNRAGFDFSDSFKRFLKQVPAGCDMGIVLFDTASGATYTFEDWFKANLTTKDGLWVGSGVDSQTAIGVTYSARFSPAGGMGPEEGYAVSGGVPRLVHLVSVVSDHVGEGAR